MIRVCPRSRREKWLHMLSTWVMLMRPPFATSERAVLTPSAATSLSTYMGAMSPDMNRLYRFSGIRKRSTGL